MSENVIILCGDFILLFFFLLREGIVTRCPLELRLKKSSKSSKWTGEIKYLKQKVKLKNPGEVEHEVRKGKAIL